MLIYRRTRHKAKWSNDKIDWILQIETSHSFKQRGYHALDGMSRLSVFVDERFVFLRTNLSIWYVRYHTLSFYDNKKIKILIYYARTRSCARGLNRFQSPSIVHRARVLSKVRITLTQMPDVFTDFYIYYYNIPYIHCDHFSSIGIA